VTRTRIDYRHSQQANRYRRQGSTREIFMYLENALPEGGVGGEGGWLVWACKYAVGFHIKGYLQIDIVYNLQAVNHLKIVDYKNIVQLPMACL